MLGAVSPDGDVTVTVRRGVGLRTSSLCKDGGVGVQSWGSGLRDTSHGGGAIGDASPGVCVVRPSRGDAAFGNCRGDDGTSGAV